MGRNEAVREKWPRIGLEQLEAVLGQLAEVNDIALDPDLIAQLAGIMSRFQLKSYDAIHVASAIAAVPPDIVTADIDFTRRSDSNLPTIHLLRAADFSSPSR